MFALCHDSKDFVDLTVFVGNDGQDRTEQLVLYDIVVYVDRVQYGRGKLLCFPDPLSAEIYAVAILF